MICFIAIYCVAFNFRGILPTEFKSSDYTNVQYIFWLGNLTLNIVKMCLLNINFNFSRYVYTCILHIKARLYNFIEKSDIHPYSTRNCNKYDMKAFNTWKNFGLGLFNVLLLSAKNMSNTYFKKVVLKWLDNP